MTTRGLHFLVFVVVFSMVGDDSRFVVFDFRRKNRRYFSLFKRGNVFEIFIYSFHFWVRVDRTLAARKCAKFRHEAHRKCLNDLFLSISD